jgi:m7GpppX diphosphatase
MHVSHAQDYTIVAETPVVYTRPEIALFMDQEIRRPSKQWIASIIEGNQEQDEVILRTDEFVLLPDTERVNRYWRIQSNLNQARQENTKNPKRTLNWLSIVHDRSVHTMRDLRGEHIPMLRRMLDGCTQAIERETGIPRDQVMAYVHYPPSVYQLHVHFSYPYGQYCHRDAYRIHSLGAIINNLEIDSDYYAKATLYVAVYKQSLHYRALISGSPPGENTSDEEEPPRDAIPLRGVRAGQGGATEIHV